jgi:hypothetical protein
MLTIPRSVFAPPDVVDNPHHVLFRSCYPINLLLLLLCVGGTLSALSLKARNMWWAPEKSFDVHSPQMYFSLCLNFNIPVKNPMILIQ